MVTARSKDDRRNALDLEADLADSYRELGLAVDQFQRNIERGIHGQVTRVKENIEHVRLFFDVPGRIGRNPWMALGIATAGGLLLGAGTRGGKGGKLASRLIDRFPMQVKSLLGSDSQQIIQKSRASNYSRGVLEAIAPLLLQAGISYMQRYFSERRKSTSSDGHFQSIGSCAE